MGGCDRRFMNPSSQVSLKISLTYRDKIAARAILLEHGVKEFSNIFGMNQIRFSKGNIRELCWRPLRREFRGLRSVVGLEA
jgi:hypothetical protein